MDIKELVVGVTFMNLKNLLILKCCQIIELYVVKISGFIGFARAEYTFQRMILCFVTIKNAFETKTVH